MPGLDLPIVGRIDGLLRLGVLWVLWDLKTTNSYHLAQLRKSGKQAWTSDVRQIQTYARILQNGGAVGIPKSVEVPIPDKALIMYVDKNVSAEEEALFDLDPDLGDEVLHIPIEIGDAHGQKKLPPKHQECEKKPLSTRVKRCSVSSVCFTKGISYQKLVS